VIVHSVSKKHNIGMLLRSATAFGVRQVVVVGRRDISTFGNHGTADFVDLKHFYHMKDARTYLKVTQNPALAPAAAQGAASMLPSLLFVSCRTVLGHSSPAVRETLRHKPHVAMRRATGAPYAAWRLWRELRPSSRSPSRGTQPFSWATR